MKNTHEFLLARDHYSAQTTLGKMAIGGKYFCETLEDTVRPTGVKVFGHTAIPEGRYRISVSKSTRFKRIMPIIFNQSNYSLIANGIRFTGIRCHGGNKHAHTAGCPLVAYNRIDDKTIQGTAEKELTAKIIELEKTGDCYITIINQPQAA